MPQISEVGDCPLCFGRLLPLSVCQSCNTVSVRTGLEEVGPQIACEDCGATNSTHFVCSACNARFPYQDILKPGGPQCPVCRNPVPAGAEVCPHCDAVLPGAAAGGPPKRRIRGEYAEEDIRELSRIPDVDRQRAEALCAAGYNALWKVTRASEAELARVKGVGPRAAAEIQAGLRLLRVVGRPKSKEEVLSEERVCPLCGTVTSLFSTRCHDCDAQFDEEELDAEFRKEVEREENRGLLAYYDVRLLEEPDDADLHYARAILLLSIGRPPEALASLDRVLELRPGDPRALQAKVRALAAARGIGGAAQVLRGIAATTPTGPPPEPSPAPAAKVRREEAPRVPRGPAQAPEPAEGEEARLLEELEQAIAGEKPPPPPLRPEVPAEFVNRKRALLAFLLQVPGVSRRAAEALSGFFADIEQVGLSDAEDIAEIPGVAPAEARLIVEAVREHLRPPEAAAPPEEPQARPPQPAPPRVAEAVPEPPPPLEREPVAPPTEAPRAPPSPPRVARPPPRIPVRPRAPAVATKAPVVSVAGRRGLINGHGLVNGRGRVNGLINGTGFVNGSAIAEPRLPRRNLVPRYLAIGSALLMLFAIAAALVPPAEPPVSVQVDGDIGDWSGAPFLDGTLSQNRNITIERTSVRYDAMAGFLYARVTVSGTAFGDAGYDTLYMFLDADGRDTTGYDLPPIGADYLARVSGSAGAVGETKLLRFSGTDPEDWNGWRADGSVPAAAKDGNVEIGVPVDSLESFSPQGFRALFAFDDDVGSESRTQVPIGAATAALRVQQEVVPALATGHTVGIGAGQALLQVTFRALGGGDVHVGPVVITNNSNGTYGVIGNFTVPGGSDRVEVVAVDTTGLPSGMVVSAEVRSVQADAPLAIVGAGARAYVGAAPTSQKRIDGLFEDWPAPMADGPDAPPVTRGSLDIQARDAAVAGNEVFLYAKLDGQPLEGSPVPQRLSRPQPSSGSGGGGSPGPPPPGRFGFDYVRFYVQTNENAPGGFVVNGLAVDRLVQVLGRDGVATNGSAYRWTPSGWRWEGSPAVGLGAEEIEVGAAMPTVSFNRTRIVAVTADWSGVADTTDSAPTRGTRGAPILVLFHGDFPLSATAKPLANVPTIDGKCNGTADEYLGADFKETSDLNFSVGSESAFLYVCVTVKADSVDDGTLDWAHILLDPDHDGVSPPESDDRLANRTSGGGANSVTVKKGNGSGWMDCGGECSEDDTAQGEFNTSQNHPVYEFKISFWDVWLPGQNNTDSDTAGFAIIVHDANGGGMNYTWGNSGVSEDNPGTWGHLDIPEFPQTVPVAMSMILVVWFIRRRRGRSRAAQSLPTRL